MYVSLEELRPVLDTISPKMRDAVICIHEAVFGQPDSKDAVARLKATVGENPNEVDDGTKVVGRAAKAGIDGDNSLPEQEDEIVNAVAKDVAKLKPMAIDLPKEDDFANLPGDGEPPLPDEPLPEDII